MPRLDSWANGRQYAGDLGQLSVGRIGIHTGILQLADGPRNDSRGLQRPGNIGYVGSTPDSRPPDLESTPPSLRRHGRLKRGWTGRIRLLPHDSRHFIYSIGHILLPER